MHYHPPWPQVKPAHTQACKNARAITVESRMPSSSPSPIKSLWKTLSLRRRRWWWVAAAFGVGTLSFLLSSISRNGDGTDDFFRAPAMAEAENQRRFEPLPIPTLGDDSRATAPAEAPRVDDGAIDDGIVPPTDRRRDELFTDEAPTTAPASTNPIPTFHPAPRYPARALRRGEAGTVLLQVHVDANGTPNRVEVVQSSRSRDLDREAQRSVERWRFRPAMRDGRPIAGRVLVPVDFDPAR